MEEEDKEEIQENQEGLQEENNEQEIELNNQKKDIKSSRRTITMIVSIIACFIIFLGLGYMYNPTGSVVGIDELHQMNIEGKESDINYMYNGFSFVYFDKLWYTEVEVKLEEQNLVSIPLHFGARDLEDIEVTGTTNKIFDQKEVYITFDAEEETFKFVALASAELSLNLAKGIRAIPIAACTKSGTAACEDRPIVNCFNKDKAVIYLNQNGDSAKVIKKGNCVELKGKDWELVKATDRLLLDWYGVMN